MNYLANPDDDFKNLPFEEKIKMMNMMMTEKQKNDGLENTKFICKDYCGKCPSYQGTGEADLAFCMIGRSNKITEEKGCLCGQCPITKTMSLRWSNYCTKGSAVELSNSGK